jgi:hypothetical protein
MIRHNTITKPYTESGYSRFYVMSLLRHIVRDLCPPHVLLLEAACTDINPLKTKRICFR